VIWSTDASGYWHAPANWSGGAVPGPGDNVLLHRPGADPIVVHSAGTNAIGALVTTEFFALTGGALTLNAPSAMLGPFVIAPPSGQSASLTVPTALTLAGPVYWTGAYAILGAGVTTLLGPSVIGRTTIGAGHRLVNRGHAVLQGITGLGSGATIENAAGALIELQNDWSMGESGPISVNPVLNNSGTLRKSTGSGRSTLYLNNKGLVQIQSGILDLGTGTHTGAFEVASGAVLSLTSGNTFASSSSIQAAAAEVRLWGSGLGKEFAGSFNAGRLVAYQGSAATPNLIFTGPAPVIRELVVEDNGYVAIRTQGGVTLQRLDLGTYPRFGGTLESTTVIDVTGLIVGQGTLRGTGTTNALGGIDAHVNVLNGHTLNNPGVAAGRFGASDGSTVNNLAGATWTMVNGYGTDSTSRFNNYGTVIWNAQAGSSPSSFGGVMHNFGVVELRNGRAVWSPLDSVNSGSLRLSNDTVLEFFYGRLQQQSSGVLEGPNADLYLYASQGNGSVRLDGRVAVRDVTVHYGDLTLTGSQAKTLRSLTTHVHSTSTVRLEGTGTSIGTLKAVGGYVEIAGAGTVVDRLEVWGGALVGIDTGAPYGPTQALILGDSGTLWIRAGSTLLPPGGVHVQTGGAIMVDGTLAASSVAIQSGKIGGNGVIDAPVILDGTLAPGVVVPRFPVSRTGVLAIDGDLLMGATARFWVDIGGTVAGSDFDRVDVAGLAVLDGSLEVWLVNGYVPVAGDSFRVLTFGSRSGEFARFEEPWISPTLAFVPVWEVDALRLDVVEIAPLTLSVSAVPEPRQFVLFVVSFIIVLYSSARCGRQHRGVRSEGMMK